MPMIDPVVLKLADQKPRQLVFSAYAARRLKERFGVMSFLRNFKEIAETFDEDTIVSVVWESIVVMGPNGYLVPMSKCPDSPGYLSEDDLAALIIDWKGAFEAFCAAVGRANGASSDTVPTVAADSQETQAGGESQIQ